MDLYRFSKRTPICCAELGSEEPPTVVLESGTYRQWINGMILKSGPGWYKTPSPNLQWIGFREDLNRKPFPVKTSPSNMGLFCSFSCKQPIEISIHPCDIHMDHGPNHRCDSGEMFLGTNAIPICQIEFEYFWLFSLWMQKSNILKRIWLISRPTIPLEPARESSLEISKSTCVNWQSSESRDHKATVFFGTMELWMLVIWSNPANLVDELVGVWEAVAMMDVQWPLAIWHHYWTSMSIITFSKNVRSRKNSTVTSPIFI